MYRQTGVEKFHAHTSDICLSQTPSIIYRPRQVPHYQLSIKQSSSVGHQQETKVRNEKKTSGSNTLQLQNYVTKLCKLCNYANFYIS